MSERTFGHKLKIAMAKADMTNNELASQANLDPSMVSRYRMGDRMPNLTTLLRIKNALGVTLDDLV